MNQQLRDIFVSMVNDSFHDLKRIDSISDLDHMIGDWKEFFNQVPNIYDEQGGL